VRRLELLARSHVFEVLIAVAAIGGAIEVVLMRDTLPEPDAPAWLAAPAIALIVLPLLGRRRFPFAAPAAVWVLGGAFSFVDGQLVNSTFSAFAAGMVAAFLLGGLPSVGNARAGLGVVVGGALVVVANYADRGPGDIVFVPVLFAIAWFAGLVLGDRSARAEAAEQRAAYAEHERESAARIAVAVERTRIARELHDVVAHAVSVMVLQVGAVRHGLPATLREDREALTAVERAGRTALAEMRQLLGAMREAGEEVQMAPQPGLDSLRGLLEEVERAGLPVRLHVKGTPAPVPRAVDLSAYRIVQEGLTNALRHARASRAEVVVGYAPEELRIEVRDDGDGDVAVGGAGHGLVGVGERVKIHGGEMTTGAVDGGGFVLRTRLPLGGHRP
jgi:signal transduction histidine kinase